MKVGGLTWWRGNYGSILQAYALYEVINSFEGVDYEIIDQYGSVRSVAGIINRARQMRPSDIVRRFVWKYSNSKLRGRNTAQEEFISKRVGVSSRSYSEKTIGDSAAVYDAFVCGSDQIWNPRLTPIGGMYWLSFVDSGKTKFSYAPSMGVSELDEIERQKVKSLLADFRGVSCREASEAHLLAEVSGRDCKHVLDPTLLLTQVDWDRVDSGLGEGFEEPYLFAYILRGDKEWRQAIERFAAGNNLKIITFPYLDANHIVKYDKTFGDVQLFDASPADFVSLVKNASCVMTDSFHAAVFSCIYHVPFRVIPKVGLAQSSRVRNLQALLGIEDRTIYENASDFTCENDIDWNAVDESVAINRRSSLQYLQNMLSDRG